ncbi:3-oxoacyl-[acyl-carrier-protein] synthase 3 [Kordia antarctica]|uniref:3-oxoacyl-[acyl-carrier-protein] synthase 3 n=1 Tax=Kordia antarctica TaxID=1218801 RepID=A0A7L4ZJ40_9FLAO|nr:3-oxoacyl-[acyl-carrier-protein] synthase III C-terminal domain-containing protein [Kordia antarctica]QHI35944.1 3-oxoacyl-[acyl-carrier-protein] synthase 3 [Kordia antarctica]
MSTLTITNISVYIPDHRITVDELFTSIPVASIPSFTGGDGDYLQYLKSDLGYSSIRTAGKLKDTDLLIGAADQLFDLDIVAPEDIDFLFMAQESDVIQKENSGQFLQMEFDMNRAKIMTISGHHCANVDAAIYMANCVAKSDLSIEKVLIAGVVSIPSAEKRMVGSYGVLGDAATCILLERNATSGFELVYTHMVSLGLLHEIDLTKDVSLLLCKYYTLCLTELMEKSGFSDKDIDHIIIQNANTALINQCISAVDLNTAKVFSDNLNTYGHLDSIDLPLNMRDLMKKGINDGAHILTFGSGINGSFIASIFKYSA